MLEADATSMRPVTRTRLDLHASGSTIVARLAEQHARGSTLSWAAR